MTKAMVIKTYGDPEIAGAIVDGMTRRVYSLDEGQLAAVKAELVRYKDMHELRVYGDQKRLRNARKELARKYSIKRHGRVYDAFMGVYGLFVLSVVTAATRLSEWNRK